MAYKEIKLEKGESKGLYDLWNAGMPGPKKQAGKKSPAKPQAGKKKAGK